jgi:AcrR family transcriptional regulator
MSSNESEPKVLRPKSKRKLDRRIRRTRDQLGDALIELMREKPFDSITIKDVLARADVGRSTFYLHFRDKDDLFLSDADEFLEAMATMLSRTRDASERVAPVREFFAHVGEEQRLYRALVESGKIHDFLELAQGHFAQGIEQRLAELPRSRGIAPASRAALAHALTGSLLSLLSWWLDRGMLASPVEMDEMFHKLVWSGVICNKKTRT